MEPVCSSGLILTQILSEGALVKIQLVVCIVLLNCHNFQVILVIFQACNL